jgi:hypothetical protein
MSFFLSLISSSDARCSVAVLACIESTPCMYGQIELRLEVHEVQPARRQHLSSVIFRVSVRALTLLLGTPTLTISQTVWLATSTSISSLCVPFQCEQ